MKDLDGKTIGVAQSATTKENLEKSARGRNQIYLSKLGSYPELKTALTSKRIDAFSVDKSILSGYVDGKTEIFKKMVFRHKNMELPQRKQILN